MPGRAEEIARRLNELRAEFGGGGIVGPNLYPIHLSEEGYENHVCTNFKGYRLIHQCFLSFYLETLKLGEHAAVRMQDDQAWHWYRSLLAFGSSIFSRARAAELLYLHGYPLDGYTLLRDLKDRAIYLAAMLLGTTDLQAILGMDMPAGQAQEGNSWEIGKRMAARMAARRKKEQKRVLAQFRGPSANLPAPIEEDLRSWEERFDEEVHLSLLTFFFENGDWLRGIGSLRTGPQQNINALAMYMNRSAEITWCHTRTLPIFQPLSEAFGSEWGRRWSLLENNLRFLVDSVAAEGKQVVQSLVSWVDLKFPFDPRWSCRGHP